MSNASQFNYVTTNRFYVEIDSSIAASFSECSGIGVTLETMPIVEGGVNDQKRFFLGDPSFEKVVLKRGTTDSTDFWDWLQQILKNEPKQRRNVSILLFNQAGETMQCWTLIGAVPIAWKLGSLQASAESVVLEDLTLAYEGLKMDKSGSGAVKLSGGRDDTGYFEGSS